MTCYQKVTYNMEHMNDDVVFKALADPSRRKLLDLLFQRDGQTLTALCAALSEAMGRFGCMKHLQLLEDAGLVITHKVGREKFHYLNPVPIQLVHDRWVSKYAHPFTQTLADLKTQLEESPVNKHTHVYAIFIQTTPEKLWHALTEGTMSQQYYFGTRVNSTWQPGAPYSYLQANGEPMLKGEVLEVDPPRRLVTTFLPVWVGENPPLSKVTFEIETKGAACKLTLIHEDLDADAPLTKGLAEGWAEIFSGLKTLLETGNVMVVAQ